MIDAVGNPQSLFILGGTSDIALATAEQYAEQRSLRIILADRPEESDRMNEAAERLRQTGSTVTTLSFDARKPETHAEVVDKAFADGDIDVTLVAFGIQGDNEKGWTDAEAARLNADVNYVAPVSLGVHLSEKLRKQGHGNLVVMCSPAGERARRTNFVYGSAKAGLDVFYTGLTYALADSGVKVTVVRPNFVRTKLTEGMKPAPMAQTPQQVASTIVGAVRKGKEQVWVPAQMRWVMTVLRHLPRVIFRRLPF
ncbi:decaprenylphospho-beta-D-erythro-pentofuranosid-2-ulose 2-reductase [Saccharopolyspora lacisalsi]|uniref:Decaprenylphospho-beta-D-erythro-pentofuranosid-2-ulose 2-reductase n=1 Tax=Halosaccharopolyspora lacisalsi TaxID=1000566 RepID=A0A839DZW1_9PSEU|nr:decaprenylphospho-beta-D-erythro-pentofuranosid-2-ulose 2-reductase [Halosaccharopolyspora lacisalsi]MBA8827482.1 decaprenylphospho-beta-D-erythro-pentofuranosid-2-ulose 2-reductase [Halosaccharopolyspora lacisalsi]